MPRGPACQKGLPTGARYMTRGNMEPRRISGLDGMMADAVKFKYISAPLSDAQLRELFQVDAVR